MKNSIYYIIIALFIFLFSSCEESLIEEQYSNTPLDNYDVFWSEFDRFYGDFEAKNINWDSLKTVYAVGLSDSSDKKQLFKSITGLLNELNDGHATLDAPGTGFYRSWNRRNKSFFGDVKSNDGSSILAVHNLIRTKYMENNFESGTYSNTQFFWGTIPFENYNMGYINIPTFAISDYPNDFIQEAVDSFNNLDAVIIDLRYNGGGTTQAFVASLNSFASEKRCYLKSKFRNGPNHTNFTEMADHFTNPHPDCLKNKPIAVLMNAYSASSSDHFILGMKSQSYVITVGDSTCGAFSAVLERIMPNGWKFRLGAQVVYGPDGNLLTDSNGKYLEGIGIAPDIYAIDLFKEFKNGNDVSLDVALKELSGKIKR